VPEAMGNGESIEDEMDFIGLTPLVEKLRTLARGSASVPQPTIIHDEEFKDWQDHANVKAMVHAISQMQTLLKSVAGYVYILPSLSLC